MMEPHNILVVGGAGFIGSNFVRYVLQKVPEFRVVVLDALTYAGNVDNLVESWADPRFSFIHGDICDKDVVQRAMHECDWVINFAAETHVDRSIFNVSSFVRTNVQGTMTLLEVARKLKVTRFIQVSTDEVYGNAEAPDGTSRPSEETDPLRPCSPYAASKAGADCLAFSYWKTYGLPLTITRCSNNYGPYQYPEKQIPLFIIKALRGLPLPIYGDGRNTRDWIHVQDHCSALLTILQAPEDLVMGKIFNIGANEERSILDNAQLILQLLEQPESLITFVADRSGHVFRHAVNATRIMSQLPWRPEVRFEQGLADTITWYKHHSDWLTRLSRKEDTFLAKVLE